MLHVKIVSFTAGGDALGARLAGLLHGMQVERYARGTDPSLKNTSLARFAQQAMFDCGALVFIGAAGIAVRAVAPFLRSKAEDPAVLVMDEAGAFVVPLLSGHLGGANALAKTIAGALGATCVLTTATDVRQVFAVDTWANSQGLAVLEPENIRYLSAALLRGEKIGLRCDLPMRGALPAGVCAGEAESGMVISCRADERPFFHTLHLVPKTVVAGIGCRRGKPAEAILRAVEAALAAQGIPSGALLAIATIDVKQDEPGLLEAARRLQVPLVPYSAEALQGVHGDFTPSAFVESTVGVDNVCERAAVLQSGGALLLKKIACDGVTVALAETRKEVAF